MKLQKLQPSAWTQMDTLQFFLSMHIVFLSCLCCYFTHDSNPGEVTKSTVFLGQKCTGHFFPFQIVHTSSVSVTYARLGVCGNGFLYEKWECRTTGKRNLWQNWRKTPLFVLVLKQSSLPGLTDFSSSEESVSWAQNTSYRWLASNILIWELSAFVAPVLSSRGWDGILFNWCWVLNRTDVLSICFFMDTMAWNGVPAKMPHKDCEVIIGSNSSVECRLEDELKACPLSTHTVTKLRALFGVGKSGN